MTSPYMETVSVDSLSFYCIFLIVRISLPNVIFMIEPDVVSLRSTLNTTSVVGTAVWKEFLIMFVKLLIWDSGVLGSS